MGAVLRVGEYQRWLVHQCSCEISAHSQSVMMRIWEWGLNGWGIYDLMSGALMSKIGRVKSELLIFDEYSQQMLDFREYPF